jgi:carbonic anhydrase
LNTAARNYPEGYRVPKKTVLLISCIDLRLMDELVHFMDYDNLTNRYDHFVLAGASLCCVTDDLTSHYDAKMLKAFNKFHHWRDSMYDHIQLAITLHGIKDIYIVEHAECGAYESFLKKGIFDSDQEELDSHRKFAAQLKDNIKAHPTPDINSLHVHTFLMDTRGNVQLMDTTNPS